MRSRLAFSTWEKGYLGIPLGIKTPFCGALVSITLCIRVSSHSTDIPYLNSYWNKYFHSRVLLRDFATIGREGSSGGIAGEKINEVPEYLTLRRSVCTESQDFPTLEGLWRRSISSFDGSWALDVLSDYLHLQNLSQRTHFWNSTKTNSCGRLLPTILVHFIHVSSIDTSLWTPLDISLHDTANRTLESNGLTWKDVKDWAYIVSGERADNMANRMSESSHKVQTFLLLHVLRHNFCSVKSFEMLLSCVWNFILSNNRVQNDNQLSQHEINPVSSKNKSVLPTDRTADEHSPLNICTPKPHLQPKVTETDINLFTELIQQLFKQARRIWPASMINIAQMACSFAESFVARANCEAHNLNPQISRLLCSMINTLIVQLSRQSKAEPYLAIVHNWNAQKALLKLAAKFQPALVLSQDSYRAIIQVFAAHKKTASETKTILRRARSWPPWIVPQHGMETKNPTDEESTRVVEAVARLREAGYGGDWFDDALRIIGGQEFDGTPTIQTRRMLPWSLGRSTEPDELNPDLWAARVVATRDIQEAWSAFTKFRKRGGVPNQEIYLAMFEKLAFDLVLQGKRRKYPVVPGDGLEVLPIPDNNFSDYYKRHLQPPSIEDLYSDMLRSGILPQGRCLSFLVRNARTPDDGLRYLRAGGLSTDVLRTLGAFSKSPQLGSVPKIPPQMLSDFLYLICRFIPKVVKAPPAGTTDNNNRWNVVRLASRSSFGVSLDHPLHLAAYLLDSQKPSSLPPWYSFFRALSLPKTIISWEFVGNPRNDILAWKILKASFNDFSNCGLYLNPRGFIIICHGFEKYMRAIFEVGGEVQSEMDEACELLKTEFKMLTNSSSGLNGLPKLYHDIRGAHLHAYLRCLVLIKDFDEIVSTIEWMAKNARELHDISRQESVNSQRNFRKVFIVVRISCQGTSFETHLRDLINSIPVWEGWPKDDELEEYSLNSPSEAELSNC